MTDITTTYTIAEACARQQACDCCTSYLGMHAYDDDGTQRYLCEGCHHAITEHGCTMTDGHMLECDGSCEEDDS